MALSITKQSGTYEINGELNSQTVNLIKNYFELLIDQSAYIKLYINKIKGKKTRLFLLWTCTIKN